MFAYHYYGLTVSSDLPLPELLSPLEASEPSAADITIRQGAVASEGLEGGQVLGPFLQSALGSLWLTVPDVARFLIRHGNEILYDPYEGVDADSIRVFLLGSCTGALLFQRGYLVLHGNAFQVGAGCVMCVGNSGIGKSTLAAAMMQRGHAIIADDVCPVDAEGHAIPGMPRIKLWQDSADKLGIDTNGLQRIRPQMEKFNYPLNGAYCAESLPVNAIYILNSDLTAEMGVERLQGMDKYLPLKNNTYRFQYMKGMGLENQHLKLASQLAARTQVSRLTRPRGRFALDELADFILADYQTQQAAHYA
jgi:hypothetical protein